MSTRSLHSVLVTVDDQNHNLDQVAQALEKAGLEGLDVMRFSGVIGGSIAKEKLAGLAAIPGVAAVEEPPTFHASE